MANFIQSFLLEIVPDTKKLQGALKKSSDDAQKMGGVIDSKVSGSLESASKSAEGFSKGIKGAKSSSDSLVGSLRGILAPLIQGAALLALKNSITGLVDDVDDLSKTAATLGLNAGDLQAWSEAAGRAGVSTGALVSSIASLQSGIEQVEIEGVSDVAVTFSRLGISIRNSQGDLKNGAELLSDLAPALSNLGKSRAFAVGEALGLDRRTVLFLRESGNNIESVVGKYRDLGVVSKDLSRESQILADNFSDFSQFLRDVRNRALTPIISSLNSLSDFVRDNSRFFKIFSATLVVSVIPALLNLSRALLFLVPGAKIVAILAAISSGIALVVDDFKAFQEGGESAIGSVIDKYHELRASLNDNVFFPLFESMDELRGRRDLFNMHLLDGIDNLKEKISDIIEFIKEIPKIVIDISDDAFSSISGAISAPLAPFIDFFSNGLSFGSGSSDPSSIPPVPLVNSSSNSSSVSNNNNSSVVVNELVINTVDPSSGGGIAQDFSDAIGAEVKKVRYQFESGRVN